MNTANQQPLSTQGDANEKEEQLGGTTNLSVDQLKKEGDMSNPGEDNPNNIENPDNLDEIRVNDDLLDQPGTNQQQSRSDSGRINNRNEEISSGSTSDEVIPPPAS